MVTQRWQKVIILTLCLALVPLVGMQPAQAASPFNDVPAGHWSFPHIVKMELRGIITGYGNGLFKPDNTVTQLEATTMAIRAMGLEQEANSTASTVNTALFNLPTSWNAAGYVSLAMERGIIDTDNFKPNQGATRAWVAQLIIRMIGAEQEANLTVTSFADDAQIPMFAKKYVALAAQKDIINGVPKANGQLDFQPNTLVTRAQLAAMISRSDRHMANVPGQLPTATIQSVIGQQIEVLTAEGKTERFFITNNTNLFDHQARSITNAQLKANDVIRYAINQAGVLSYVEVVDQSVAVPPTIPVATQNTFQGIVMQHFRENNLLIIRDKENKLHTYSYSNLVTVKDKLTNQVLSIGDVQEADEVEIRLVNGAIVQIDIQSKSLSGISKGKIYSLNIDSGILTLEQNNRITAYNISNRVTVEYDGVRFATIRDLNTGDEVEVTVENQMVEVIKLVKPYQKESFDGRIVAISTHDWIVTIRTQGGELKAYDLSRQAKITIQGVSSPSIADLLVDDQVTFIVENNQIASIEVKNRAYQDEVQGEIISYDSKRMLLTVEDKNGDIHVYKIDNFAFLDLNKRNPSLDDLKSGMFVSLKLDKNVVKEVTMNNRIEGKIEQVDKNRNFITIHDGTSRKSYNLSSRTVDVRMYTSSRADIEDLKEDQEVIIHLEENVITRIDVKAEIHTVITEVNNSSERIEVKDGRNSTKRYYLNSSTKITIPGISNARIGDLQTDDIVTLKFVGNDLKEIIVIPPYYGYISSISEMSNRMTVKTSSGEETLTINNYLTVKNQAGNSISASTLRENDYVRVVRIGNDVSLTVASLVEGKLFSISGTQGRVYFYDKDGKYKNYELGRDVVAWGTKGNYLLGDLKENTQIVMYLFDNKVVGIYVK